MKCHAVSLIFVLLPAFSLASSQKTVTKPVLTRSPAPLQTGQAAPPATTKPLPLNRPLGQGTPAAADGTNPTFTVVPDASHATDSSVRPGAPASSSASVPPPPTSSTRYIISPDDTISVTVWREPGLSGSFPVRPDGMISLALVGDLQASGFTPMHLSEDIALRLKKFVNDPSVTVTVLGVHVKEIFLLGEILHVGALPLTADMTPLQAISAAGGLSPFAKAKRIYILRTEQGRQRKIPFDYKKAIKDGNQQGVTLSPGDTIVVP